MKKAMALILLLVGCGGEYVFVDPPPETGLSVVTSTVVDTDTVCCRDCYLYEELEGLCLDRCMVCR